MIDAAHIVAACMAQGIDAATALQVAQAAERLAGVSPSPRPSVPPRRPERKGIGSVDMFPTR
jgi:hypothetical protein